jgi:hypothetical protein
MNRIINMITRQVMHIFINKGIDHFSKKQNLDPNSPEGRQLGANAKSNAKAAKQSMRMIRRIGRF